METMRNGFPSGVHCAKNYVKRLIDFLRELDFDQVDRLIQLFTEARERDATIFFMGNGGSAATACHFANDMGNTDRLKTFTWRWTI